MGTLDNTSIRIRTTRRRTATLQAETNAETTHVTVSAFTSEPAPNVETTPTSAQTQPCSVRRKKAKDNPDQKYFDLI